MLFSKVTIPALSMGTLLLYGWNKYSHSAVEMDDRRTHMAWAEEELDLQVGEIKDDLPYFTMEEIKEHTTRDVRVYVTYKDGVYDITDWIDLHPGGKMIEMAFGGPIDPFWRVYQQHNVPYVLETLESYRIGNVDPKSKSKEKEIASDDPYANEPDRHPALQIVTNKPFNAESPTRMLADTFYTPNDLFYVRNHLPVPMIKPQDYKLSIYREGEKEPIATFSLKDLKTKFEQKEIDSTVQCAGNRRSEMNKTGRKVKGNNWEHGAISNAKWKGVLLRDVLKFIGFDEDHDEGFEHVWMEGLDTDPLDPNFHYAGSIPYEKATSRYGDTMLAFEMNGEPLPLDHGYPVRMVVPGFAGARQIKWLGNITLSKDESHSKFQRLDYKGIGPNVTLDKVQYDKYTSINELPVQSAICQPEEGDQVEAGMDCTIKGYAYSGGGKGIVRVDVSIDGGETWDQANLYHQSNQKRDHVWAWTQFDYTFEVPEDKQELDLVCKAIDSNYNVQPSNSNDTWNARGVLSSAYMHAKVEVIPCEDMF